MKLRQLERRLDALERRGYDTRNHELRLLWLTAATLVRQTRNAARLAGASDAELLALMRRDINRWACAMPGAPHHRCEDLLTEILLDGGRDASG